MTNKLSPCPFCGMQSHQDWDDTMYPTGTGWREDPWGNKGLLRHYLDRTERHRIRASIRRNNTERKSVQEGKPDRIADLLEEAANEIERLEEYEYMYKDIE